MQIFMRNEAKNMRDIVNIDAAVDGIIGILAQEEVPISSIPRVFEKCINKINAHTIPYNPIFSRTKDFPNSETTSSATEPKG